eukprot:CAMPEP_0194204248 /NCGR_PEP_ID=MMETSP0156-20130528/3832_1 /TAXON_ID=33649 /ORGANISM="Thalassionema nitzschioides, Strain L26-B" /LENGTH=2106 /DNA_ID=CAMNT_0038930221 /DNA_START=226 /DNA_END=6547 /DNA_ORIENTATION=+
MIVVPPPPPGNPPRRSPRKSGTRSMQHRVGTPPPPPPGSPPSSSPRKRTQRRRGEHDRPPPNPDYHHRFSGRGTKRSNNRQSGIKSSNKNDETEYSIQEEYQRRAKNVSHPVDDSRKNGVSIIEARRKAALALYESADMPTDDDTGFVVARPPSLRSTKENDFCEGNDSIEVASSDSGQHRKGLFRKFAGRSTKKNLSKKPSPPSGRLMKKNRNKLGIPFGAKPGSSYNSTPHSAEIVPRKTANMPLLTNKTGEHGKNNLYEPFEPSRFDPPSTYDVTVDDISHLTDPTYDSPPKKRSTPRMMDSIEESSKQKIVQREPAGQRYDSDPFSHPFYSEGNVDEKVLRALADDVESVATTHATSVTGAIGGKHDLEQISLNENKDNVVHDSHEMVMETIEEKMLTTTGSMYNLDDDSISGAYCHRETANNFTGIGERLIVGGLRQLEAIDESMKTPKLGNLSQNDQLYPEEISDRIFGTPTSIDAGKDVSSTLEFQKALENDAKDRTSKDRTWEDLETPRTSNRFFANHRDVEDAPQVVPGGIASDPSTLKSPVSSNAKAHSDYTKDSSDDTKTTVTLSPESNLSDDLSSTSYRQSEVRHSPSTTGKHSRRSLHANEINMPSSSSVHSSTDSGSGKHLFDSKYHYTAEKLDSTASCVATNLESPTLSKQTTKEIRTGGNDRQSISSKSLKGSATTPTRVIEVLEREFVESSMTTASKISNGFSAKSSNWNEKPYGENEGYVFQTQGNGDEIWNGTPSNEEVEGSSLSNKQRKGLGNSAGFLKHTKNEKRNLHKNGQSSGPPAVEPSTYSRNFPRKPEQPRLSDFHTNRLTDGVQISASESIISSITSDSSIKTTSSPGSRTSPLSKRHENIMRLERLRKKKRNVEENEKLPNTLLIKKTASTDRCVGSNKAANNGTDISRTGATSIALSYLKKSNPEHSRSKKSFVSEAGSTPFKGGPPTPETFNEASSTPLKSGPPTPETFNRKKVNQYSLFSNEKLSSNFREDVNVKHFDAKTNLSSDNNGSKLQRNWITTKEKSTKVSSLKTGPLKPEEALVKRKKLTPKMQFELEQSELMQQRRNGEKESFTTWTSTVGKLSLTALQVKQKKNQASPYRLHRSAGEDIIPSPKRRPQMRLPIRHSSRQKYETSQNIASLGYIKKRKTIIEPPVVAIGLKAIRRNRRNLIEKGEVAPIQPTPRKKRLTKPRRHSEIETDESKMDPIQRAGFRVLSKAAVCIQTHYRQRMAYREAIERLWAVMQIQSIFRRWRCETYLYAHAWGATRIQSVFRGWQARDFVEETQFCAIEIQRIVRGHLASIRIYDDIYRILLLQSMIRRYLAQQEALRRLGAAIILQAVCRSFVVRLDIRIAIGAATRIQSLLRGYSTRLAFNKAKIQHLSALIIQKRWRGFQAYTEYIFSIADVIIAQRNIRKWIAKRILQQKKDNRCATKIQAQWRRYQSQMRCLYKLVHIIIVQSTVRRWLAINRVRNVGVEHLSAKIIQSWWKVVYWIKQKRFHSAATKIQATWRCFWESTQYLIMNYEIVRIQAVVRGFQARIGASLQMGCAIMIQAAIRRYFALKSVEIRKMEIACESSYTIYLRERHATTCIQKSFLNWKTKRAEKSAAATIQRFFIMVKAEVDREIFRHNEEMKRKTMKLKRGALRTDVIDEEKMLEGAWLHALRNSPHAKAPMKRTNQVDPPISGAPPVFGDPPGKRVNLGSRGNFVDTTHINKSIVDPRARQVDDFNCGTPKRHNYSDARRRDTKSYVSATTGGSFVKSNHALSPSYHLVNAESYRREIKPREEIYEVTSHNLFNRAFPARISTLSCQELSDDLSLEEAWIDTEVRQVKQHVQQMRSSQRHYVERHGLDKSGSEESPNLRSRLYIAKTHSFEYHGKSKGTSNQEFTSHDNHLTNQDAALNHARSRGEQVVVGNYLTHNNVNDRCHESPNDKVYRVNSHSQSMDAVSAQHFDQPSSLQASTSLYNVNGNVMPHRRGQEIMSQQQMQRHGATAQDTHTSAGTYHAEQMRYSPSHVTKWHDRSSSPNLKQDTQPYYDEQSEMRRGGVVYQQSTEPDNKCNLFILSNSTHLKLATNIKLQGMIARLMAFQLQLQMSVQIA